ncbi:ribonuclease domain-containing protein, partial [Fusobacterium sp. PH5-44]|uniref:ribonuclease domain-containing protein n=1 Tax=unclassified Fusobacterium TaxID=2648384 RepID=UPI003D2314C3
KRQDTNSTFVNSIAYENGIKVNFEERGINTSLDNAQVITRDKEIEQIDTSLHTDMLNQSTRQQFVIDFLKTTTLVPQVAKGIGQGINNKELGQNVLGQLANNLGKNGFNIVAYAYDVDEKLKNIIEDHYINGKYGVGLDEYNMSEIAGLLKPLLAEYGKDFYDIKFVEADNIKAGMSINDKEGVVYINTYGDGFGHSSQMLEQLGHEGMHGTYADKNVDEKAASMLTKIPSKGWSSSIGATAITINAKGMIEASTNQYYKDRANGDLRDAAAALYAAAYILLSNPKIADEVGKLAVATWALIEMSGDAKEKIKDEKDKEKSKENEEEKSETAKKDEPLSEKGKVGEKKLDELPQHVQDAYDEYTKGGWTSKESATSDTLEDGPHGNKEKLLPEKDDDGNEIEYREHDVNNAASKSTRGKERFVTGSDGSVYYTDIHYQGYIKIK